MRVDMQYLARQQRKAGDLYREFPKPYWTLVMATFIDRLGGALLFPFFALYLTDRFQIGMSEVGLLFAIWSLAAFPGSLLGGALADRMGRKYLLIFSLLASSLSTLAMGFVSSLQAFYVLALVSGVFTEVGGPAYNAMVADLLPERQRAQRDGAGNAAPRLCNKIAQSETDDRADGESEHKKGKAENLEAEEAEGYAGEQGNRPRIKQ